GGVEGDRPGDAVGEQAVADLGVGHGQAPLSEGHVCHVAFVHALDGAALPKEARQRNRAQLHVACTRSSLFLDVWGVACPLLKEAEQARALLSGAGAALSGCAETTSSRTP